MTGTGCEESTHLGVANDVTATDTNSSIATPKVDDITDISATSQLFDRAELAQRAGVKRSIVDLIIDAGLLVPIEESGNDNTGSSTDNTGSSTDKSGERFGPSTLDMLKAALTFVSEGVAAEELSALAMRHATNVEAVIDDAIDLFKPHTTRHNYPRSELLAIVQRLVPVATALIANHFENTLTTRVLARLDDIPASTSGVVVCARRLNQRVNPLAVYAAADPTKSRNLWLCSSSGLGIATIGAAEVIEPCGSDRFAIASAARTVLEARVRFYGPDDAPTPILLGGFSFAPSDTPGNDCRLILGELTVIDRADGTWALAATQVGPDNNEESAWAKLEQQLESFATRPLPDLSMDSTSSTPASELTPASDAQTIKAATHLSDDSYLDLVSAGIEGIVQGELSKVVLARSVTLEIDISSSATMSVVLDRLRARNPNCAIFAFDSGDRVFFGATPEELVTLNGSKLHTTALAGTAARGNTPGEDERLAAELLTSAKTRSEHRFVVDGITEALVALGLTDLTSNNQPDILRLTHLQHLRTPITARVQHRRSRMNDMDVIRVAGALHPTPAVGGTPTETALAFIAEHEDFNRGWYAAPVGWCDLHGNGELRVALRSGLAGPGWVQLFAGAGIVADSVPASELEETSIKLRSLLDVFITPTHHP